MGRSSRSRAARTRAQLAEWRDAAERAKAQRPDRAAWNTPISPEDISLNDLANVGSAASFVLECHAEEFRTFIREKTGDDISPEQLAASIARAKTVWDRIYWDEVVPGYMG